jgi:hypothetical protein
MRWGRRVWARSSVWESLGHLRRKTVVRIHPRLPFIPFFVGRCNGLAFSRSQSSSPTSAICHRATRKKELGVDARDLPQLFTQVDVL